jgi:hypothetical protein
LVNVQLTTKTLLEWQRLPMINAWIRVKVPDPDLQQSDPHQID